MSEEHAPGGQKLSRPTFASRGLHVHFGTAVPRNPSDSEFDRRKLSDPASPLPASRGRVPSPSYRLRAAGCGLRAAGVLLAEPGRRRCAQLEDSAGREARSAPAAGEAETAGCRLSPPLPELTTRDRAPGVPSPS